jgi:Glycosyl transferase family 11
LISRQLLKPLRSPSGPPIVILLRGRLGNQLFQYAAAVELKRSRNRNVLFYSYEIPKQDLILPLLVGPDFRFANARELLASGGWIPWYDSPSWERAFYRSLYRWLFRARRRHSFLQAPGAAFVYDCAFEHLDRIRSIEGYFQHDSYWKHVIDEVADATAAKLTTMVASDHQKVETVGVHVRGLDYGEYGWMLPLGYYRAALEIVIEATGVGQAEIFGDDLDAIEAVKGECVNAGLVIVGMGRTDLLSPLEDLSRLASCRHLVCSNSTFAWWGACLGDRRTLRDERRVVVIPQPWLNGLRTSLARSAWTSCNVPGWTEPPDTGAVF